MLRLNTSETSELLRGVLQFGHESEVPQPASLRRRVEEALESALKAYRRS